MYKDMNDVLKNAFTAKEKIVNMDREKEIIDATFQLTKIINLLLDRVKVLEEESRAFKIKLNALEYLIMEGREN